MGNAKQLIDGLEILRKYFPDGSAYPSGPSIYFAEEVVLSAHTQEREALIALGWFLDSETQFWYYSTKGD